MFLANKSDTFIIQFLSARTGASCSGAFFWQVVAVQPDKPVQRFVQVFGAVEVVWAQHLVCCKPNV